MKKSKFTDSQIMEAFKRVEVGLSVTTFWLVHQHVHRNIPPIS